MFFLKKKRENENTKTILREYLSQTSDMYRQENSATGEILDRIQNEQAEMQNFLRKKMETLDDFLDQLQEEKEVDDEMKELQEKSSEREKKAVSADQYIQRTAAHNRRISVRQRGMARTIPDDESKAKTGWLSCTGPGNRYCRGTIQLQIT